MAMTQGALLESVPKGLFIDGVWRDASDGATLPVDDPATGKILAHVASATVADGKAALDAAVAAQHDWARTAPRDRGEILRRAYEAIIARTEEFALLMTLEMGKPLAEARGEVVYGAEFFRWFSEEAVRIHGRYAVAPNGATRLMTMKQPVGPTLMITPWNFPLAMGTRKIGPAIAAGCTMVVKPAHQTPLTMLLLTQVLDRVRRAQGVLNVVSTAHSGAVMEPIIRDPRLRKLTFTGSTGVGQKLVEQSAQGLLRLSMELGGNAPFIVFDDADIDAAVDGAMLAKMRNIGEACTAANRFLVHESVAEEFSPKFAERMAALRVGKGTVKGVDVGPLVDRKAREASTPSCRRPWPAVPRSSPVVDRCRARAGSTPRPSSPTSPRRADRRRGDLRPGRADLDLRDRGGGDRRANDTAYGLVGYAFTRDLARALRVSEELEFGMVGINQGVVSNPAALRRRQGQRVWPRGRLRGHR
jgi:succinate-semialdehyde dehydrogenase/glutarate-semialdehyde dehydrogenase